MRRWPFPSFPKTPWSRRNACRKFLATRAQSHRLLDPHYYMHRWPPSTTAMWCSSRRCLASEHDGMTSCTHAFRGHRRSACRKKQAPPNPRTQRHPGRRSRHLLGYHPASEAENGSAQQKTADWQILSRLWGVGLTFSAGGRGREAGKCLCRF